MQVDDKEGGQTERFPIADGDWKQPDDGTASRKRNKGVRLNRVSSLYPTEDSGNMEDEEVYSEEETLVTKEINPLNTTPY